MALTITHVETCAALSSLKKKHTPIIIIIIIIITLD